MTSHRNAAATKAAAAARSARAGNAAGEEMVTYVVRLPRSLLERLDEAAGEGDRATLVRRLLDEGLRGPAGDAADERLVTAVRAAGWRPPE